MDRYLKSSEASKLLGISSSSLWELKSTKVLEAGKHWIYVTGKPRSNVLFNIDKIRQWQIDMTKIYRKSGKRCRGRNANIKF